MLKCHKTFYSSTTHILRIQIGPCTTLIHTRETKGKKTQQERNQDEKKGNTQQGNITIRQENKMDEANMI